MSSRTSAHIIDTKAIKKVMNIIPDHWIIRELTERDYGIDLMVEIFNKNGQDNSGKTKYESSGCICYLQVKGTANKIIEKDNHVTFTLKKTSLNYVEKFPIPFFLIYVDINDEGRIYFTWLQRYIRDKLNQSEVDWRELEQKSFTIKIPIENLFEGSLEKIVTISSQLKYREEYAIFLEKFSGIHNCFTMIDTLNLNDEFYNWVISELDEIKKLSILFNYNYCCVGVEDIDSLRNLILGIKQGTTQIAVLKDPDESYSKLKLLLNESLNKYEIEKFDSEMTGACYY